MTNLTAHLYCSKEVQNRCDITCCGILVYLFLSLLITYVWEVTQFFGPLYCIFFLSDRFYTFSLMSTIIHWADQMKPIPNPMGWSTKAIIFMQLSSNRNITLKKKLIHSPALSTTNKIYISFYKFIVFRRLFQVALYIFWVGFLF